MRPSRLAAAALKIKASLQAELRAEWEVVPGRQPAASQPSQPPPARRGRLERARRARSRSRNCRNTAHAVRTLVRTGPLRRATSQCTSARTAASGRTRATSPAVRTGQLRRATSRATSASTLPSCRTRATSPAVRTSMLSWVTSKCTSASTAARAFANTPQRRHRPADLDNLALCCRPDFVFVNNLRGIFQFIMIYAHPGS
jgi:hypothetical protein